MEVKRREKQLLLEITRNDQLTKKVILNSVGGSTGMNCLLCNHLNVKYTVTYSSKEHNTLPGGWLLFCFILLTHKRLHREEVYREFQPSYGIFRRSGAKGCSDHRFRARTPAYTAQLLALHHHGANIQYRAANQI